MRRITLALLASLALTSAAAHAQDRAAAPAGDALDQKVAERLKQTREVYGPTEKKKTCLGWRAGGLRRSRPRSAHAANFANRPQFAGGAARAQQRHSARTPARQGLLPQLPAFRLGAAAGLLCRCQRAAAGARRVGRRQDRQGRNARALTLTRPGYAAPAAARSGWANRQAGAAPRSPRFRGLRG